MIEKRTVITAFVAKPSERKNIEKVASLKGVRLSDYLRDVILNDVKKQLK